MNYGDIVGIKERPKGRVEVTAVAGLTVLQRITLLPGVLGTPDGAEVIRRASTLPDLAYVEVRRSARDARKTG